MKTENHKRKWLRIAEIEAIYGVTKPVVFRILQHHREIKTAVLKSDPSKSRGTRIIERESWERYIEDQVQTE